MAKVVAVSALQLPYTLKQDQAKDFTRNLFQKTFPDIDRYLNIFSNSDISTRHLCMPLDWYEKEHSLEERNNLFIEQSTSYGIDAIKVCLEQIEDVDYQEIDAIFFISSTGISTPSIEARIMNHLPFSEYTKRIPIWGLGCAGGAAGLSRAFDYCNAYPEAKVLVLCIELCSLTFQQSDSTKSNLVGTSLFGDGVACALVCGNEVTLSNKKPLPTIISTQSKWMPNSEDVMGWDIKNSGFHVVFSKSIPGIIKKWLAPFVTTFLAQHELTMSDIQHFIAHPGGKKVLFAYEESLQIPSSMTEISRQTLMENGNMSSPTVLFVLEKFLQASPPVGDLGILTALGPGFSGELLLLEWRE